MDITCPNCGTTAGSDDNFCPKCGTKLEKEESEPVSASDQAKLIAMQEEMNRIKEKCKIYG